MDLGPAEVAQLSAFLHADQSRLGNYSQLIQDLGSRRAVPPPK